MRLVLIPTLLLGAALVAAGCGSAASASPSTAPASVAASTQPSVAASSAAASSPAASSAGASAPAAGGDAVNIVNFAFAPKDLSVKVGTTVTFTNSDSAAHTATADNNSFDSGNIAPGANFKQTFSTAGAVTYHCSIHSFMAHATITVTP
jgi:plastocyanin